MVSGLLLKIPGKRLSSNDEDDINDDIALEIMRELPENTISLLISDSIFNTNITDFVEFLNIKEYTNIKLLKAPSINDKCILINAISISLKKIGIDDNYFKYLIPSITKVYSELHLEYTEDDITYSSYLGVKTKRIVPENLKFISKNCVATIGKSLDSGSEIPTTELDITKLQLFVFAATWIDVDEYLKYLYYLYK